MPKLNRILWSILILGVTVATIMVSFGMILVGVSMLTVYGVYRHYFPKKKGRRYPATPNGYTFGEVIDLKPEVIHRTIEAKKPLK